MEQTWGFRVARAALYAATSVLLAALGHVLMSEAALPWWALPMAFGWIGAVAWIVADRERGVLFVVGGTLVTQAGLHTVFTLAQSMGPAPTHGGHDGHQLTGTSSVGMLAAHTLAALLCGLWLAYGERAAFAVLRAVVVRILLPLRLISMPLLTAHRPAARPTYSPRLLRDPLLVHSIVSRGPPRGIAVA
ncbi:hypothetical protein [Kribbella sp. HUAS MG21]|uniref:MFS transporter n=1 Tax=Kribbella sp. HUAS MG21 TaxID=3160966 RepID=A0AAU7TEK3_9ACTN